MNRHPIGVFGDMHCNLDALTAMLNREPQVKTWICLGDFVGLFPQINETLDLLREIEAICILGDHEIALLKGEELLQSRAATESLNHQQLMLSETNRIFLNSIPYQRIVEIGENTVMMIHDLNDNSGEKYLFDFDKISSKLSSKISTVLFANTHLPTMHLGKFHNFYNPGSLGFPIQKNPKPTYLLFDEHFKEPLFMEFSPDQTNVKKALLKENYNSKYHEYLESGYRWPIK
jgi:predicted phosphodiesterase